MREDARTHEGRGRVTFFISDEQTIAEVRDAYKNLKSEVEANRSFLESFSARRKDISAYSRVTVSKVRVVDPAVAFYRVRPDHPKNRFTGA